MTPPTDAETETTSLAVSNARSALRRAMDETDDARARFDEAQGRMTAWGRTLGTAELREIAAFGDLTNAIEDKRREAASS